jgi:hypothetical protein
MKCVMCGEEIEEGGMSFALFLGNFPPATIKEVPVHTVCPNYTGWNFYGGFANHPPLDKIKDAGVEYLPSEKQLKGIKNER